MPLYDVFCPSRTIEGRDIAITVKAQNWVEALKHCLDSMGAGLESYSGLICDVQSDSTLNITVPQLDKWFRIKELGQVEGWNPDTDRLELPDLGPPPTAAPAAAPEPEPEAAQPPDDVDTADVEAPIPTPPPQPGTGPLTKAVRQLAKPPVPRGAEADDDFGLAEDETTEPQGTPIERRPPDTADTGPWLDGSQTTDPVLTPDAAAGPEPDVVVGTAVAVEPEVVVDAVAAQPAEPGADLDSAAAPLGQVDAEVPAAGAGAADEILAEIFERTMDLYDEHPDPDLIVNIFLDLALEKIPAVAGNFYVADISSHDLQLAAARGPRSPELLGAGTRVPMGEGMAGLCAQEGMSLYLDDLDKYPRFAAEVRNVLGGEATSAICVALEKEGRCYGALQLVDRADEEPFGEADLNILKAIGHHAVELLSQITG